MSINWPHHQFNCFLILVILGVSEGWEGEKCVAGYKELGLVFKMKSKSKKFNEFFNIVLY